MHPPPHRSPSAPKCQARPPYDGGYRRPEKILCDAAGRVHAGFGNARPPLDDEGDSGAATPDEGPCRKPFVQTCPATCAPRPIRLWHRRAFGGPSAKLRGPQSIMVRCLGGTGEVWLGWGGVAGHQTQALTSPLIHHYSEGSVSFGGMERSDHS